jgi:hypothetical protein
MTTFNDLSKSVYDEYFLPLLSMKPYLAVSVSMLPQATKELYDILQETHLEIVAELGDNIEKSVRGIKKIFTDFKGKLTVFYNKNFGKKMTDDINRKTSNHFDVPMIDITNDGAEDFANVLSDSREKNLSIEDTRWGLVSAQTIIKTTFMMVVNKITNTIGKVHNVFNKKKWVAIKDERTRYSHSVVDGTIIGANELFDVGNSEMEYPLDDSHGAGAEEIANCRCTLQLIKKKGLF